MVDWENYLRVNYSLYLCPQSGPGIGIFRVAIGGRSGNLKRKTNDYIRMRCT